MPPNPYQSPEEPGSSDDPWFVPWLKDRLALLATAIVLFPILCLLMMYLLYFS